MRIPVPRVYLGTMTFGWAGQTSSIVDESSAIEMVKKFISYNDAIGEKEYLIDTARIYAGGKTETIVGNVIDKLLRDTTESISGDIKIGTKANPASAQGDLSTIGIQKQVQTSLQELKVSSIGEYYLHQPDTNTPLLESLKCLNELIPQGTISSIGMSNYHAIEMERAFTLCKEHKLNNQPIVYQGLYNPLNRLVEDELLPLLKENGCSFVAYNPLAAGLLTGKHKSKTDVMEGRFKNNPNYLPRFYTDANFNAIEIIKKACDKENISMIEATYRWLLRHSALNVESGDGILIGASSIQQLNDNLKACEIASDKENGVLSNEILQAFDEGWEITKKSNPFPYWRSYSSDMPNREALHPGASYTVSKK